MIPQNQQQTNHVSPASRDYFAVAPAVVLEQRVGLAGETKGFVLQINRNGRKGYLPDYEVPRYCDLQEGDTLAVLAKSQQKTKWPRLIHPTIFLRRKKYAIETLTQLLDQGDWTQQSQLLRVIGQCFGNDNRSDLIELLTAHLKSNDVRIRYAAAAACKVMFERDDDLTEMIELAEADASLLVRAAALQAIENSRTDSSDVVRLLQRIIEDGPPLLQTAAWRALNSIAPEHLPRVGEFEQLFWTKGDSALPGDLDLQSCTFTGDSSCPWDYLDHLNEYLVKAEGMDADQQAELLLRSPMLSPTIIQQLIAETMIAVPATLTSLINRLLFSTPEELTANLIISVLLQVEGADSIISDCFLATVREAPGNRQSLPTVIKSNFHISIRTAALGCYKEFHEVDSEEIDLLAHCIGKSELTTTAGDVLRNNATLSARVLPKLLDQQTATSAVSNLQDLAPAFGYVGKRVLAEKAAVGKIR